jgi:hypothetical protein
MCTVCDPETELLGMKILAFKVLALRILGNALNNLQRLEILELSGNRMYSFKVCYAALLWNVETEVLMNFFMHL